MLRWSRQLCWVFLAVVACRAPSTLGTGQDGSVPHFTIAYRLAMSEPASHLFDVRIDVGGVSGDVLRLQMPVWSPGRYARFDFARVVQDLTMTGPGGVPLRWERENGSLWRVYPAGARSRRSSWRARYRAR